MIHLMSELEKHANNTRILVWHGYGMKETGFVKNGLILLDRHRYINEWSNKNDFQCFIKLSELEEILNQAENN